MDLNQWKQYYTGILSRTFLRPEKKSEIIERCGGLLLKETEGAAIKRLKAEIKVIADATRL